VISQGQSISLCMIAPNKSRLFQGSNPAQTRRSGNSGPMRQLNIGHSSIGLQVDQNAPINAIQLDPLHNFLPLITSTYAPLGSGIAHFRKENHLRTPTHEIILQESLSQAKWGFHGMQICVHAVGPHHLSSKTGWCWCVYRSFTFQNVEEPKLATSSLTQNQVDVPPISFYT
jgi:hypothetical protein